MRRAWDQVLVLFVSNNPYPLSGLGGRPRLDAGALWVLLPPPGPPSARPAAAAPAPRRRLALDRVRFERLLRPWRLLDRVGHREFGPGGTDMATMAP